LTGETANDPVKRDDIADGPSVMSFEVPNNTYTRLPMNAEYNPYYKNKNKAEHEGKYGLLESFSKN
jgi:hypothetical protein